MYEIRNALCNQAAQSQISALQKELHKLAAECTKAFTVCGLQHSSHPQLKEALKLCSSYTIAKKSDNYKSMASSTINSLWKNAETITCPSLDQKELATAVLGNNLVDTLTGTDNMPPDVSYLSK